MSDIRWTGADKDGKFTEGTMTELFVLRSALHAFHRGQPDTAITLLRERCAELLLLAGSDSADAPKRIRERANLRHLDAHAAEYGPVAIKSWPTTAPPTEYTEAKRTLDAGRFVTPPHFGKPAKN
jgi:hypothetical protein